MTVQRIDSVDEAMDFLLARIDGYRALNAEQKTHCIPVSLSKNGERVGYSLIVTSQLDPRACSVDVALDPAGNGMGGIFFRQLLAYVKDLGFTRVVMPVILGSPVDGYLRRLNPSFSKPRSDSVTYHVFNLRRWE